MVAKKEEKMVRLRGKPEEYPSDPMRARVGVILLYLTLLRILLIGDGGTGCRVVQTLRGRAGSLAF